MYKDSSLSFLRYLANNSPLPEDSTIRKLMDFVGSMLWFRRVDTGNSFMGLLSVTDHLDSFIISHGLTEKFEKFLNDHDVNERLKVAKSPDGREGLYFAHEQALPFLLLHQVVLWRLPFCSIGRSLSALISLVLFTWMNLMLFTIMKLQKKFLI